MYADLNSIARLKLDFFENRKPKTEGVKVFEKKLCGGGLG
jgi:hypothetical protein